MERSGYESFYEGGLSMAEVKWIKITTDMFDNRKLKHLRRLPDGNNIVLIWVMLLTMAGRCNSGGMIFLTENIPYTPKMLADELDFEENTVQLALKALEELNMIVTNGNFFSISGWEEYQSIDKLQEIREYNRLAKQRSRAKQRLLMESTICQYCGNTATGYDHIIAKNNGGSDDESNKIPCCKKCNSTKKDNSVVDFLNMNLNNINLDIVCSNQKLSKFVKFNGSYFDVVKDNVNDSQGNCQRCQDTDIDIEKDKDIEKYKYIVDYLNQKAGTNYKSTSKKTKTCIHARLEEGFSVDDFKIVIDKKCNDWLNTDFEQYLRPETLFGTKFESYLNAKVTKKNPVNTGVPAGNNQDDLDAYF